MAKESIFTKVRKKVDKEFASELAAREKAEKEAAREAARAARAEERRLEKEAALARYKAERELTVEKFFEISGLTFPESLAEIRDHYVSDFTADPRRLTPDTIFMYWGGIHSAAYTEKPLESAVNSDCLLIISDTPCDYPRTLILPDTDENGDSVIRNACAKAAHHIRKMHKAKIVTVTGSVGKTSTKEMIEAVIRAHYKKPLISKGNNNSFFAVTRNILELKHFTNVFLQEVGANSPRTVELSARELEADICVYTNIGQSHIESYGSLEALIEDKTSLSYYGSKEGIAIINYDDENLMNHKFGQAVITYSLDNPGAMYYAEDIVSDGEGYTFTIADTQSGEKTAASVKVLGEHNILNAVAAFAVGKALKIKTEEITEGIAAYRPSGMRQNMLNVGGYHIFADCYNSSLLAVDNTLNAMDQMTLPGEKGRRIAVLGDVLELGEFSEETHREMGRIVAEHDVDVLLAYGKDIRFAVEEAAAAGIDARFYTEKSDIEQAVKDIVTKDDIVLFKASHGVNIGSVMDKIFGTDVNESTSIGHKQYRLENHGDFEFYIFENSASVRRYLGSGPCAEVPASIEAEVDDHLNDCTVMRTLPVEKIGKTAFRGMDHVKEVILPETVVRIRGGAFKGSGLTSFKAPDSLLTIGEEAFAECPVLETAELPQTIREVAEDAFGENVTISYR